MIHNILAQVVPYCQDSRELAGIEYKLSQSLWWGADYHSNKAVQGWGSSGSIHPELEQSFSYRLQCWACSQHVCQVTHHLVASVCQAETHLVCWGPVSAEIVRTVSTGDHLSNNQTFGTLKTVTSSC